MVVLDEERFEITKKVSILGIIGNIFLLILKLSVGFVFLSQAMIADAVNSAGDIFASLMTYIGNKISNEPKDEDHNYGHGKAEYIFSLLIGISMIFCGGKILINSAKTLINKTYFSFSWYLILVCLITIITKLCLYIYTNKKGKEFNSLLIIANSKDHINDVFITLSTLIGILFSFLGIYWLDSIVGILISIWICYTGIKIFIEGYSVLMDKSINNKIIEEIENKIKTYNKIDHIDKITSKPVGNKYIIIIKLSIDGQMTINESHEIVSKLKYDILSINHIYDVIIHVNPA